MKTFMLVGMLVVVILTSKLEAQNIVPEWSVNVHASPFLFQGQIVQTNWFYNYTYHTFLGIGITKKLNQHVNASFSLDYTKAWASYRLLMTASTASSIPFNSFLTESYDSYLEIIFLPTSYGILQPHLSTGIGLAYFTHESKQGYNPGPFEYFVPVPATYQSQRFFVPFVPAEAGMFFDVCQLGNFKLGFDASVLAMFSLRKNVVFAGAGKMTQPISAGIITGLTLGW
jgi:hypothetical protein